MRLAGVFTAIDIRTAQVYTTLGMVRGFFEKVSRYV